MTFFDDIMDGETLAGIRTKVVAWAATAKLLVTDWIVGAVGHQTFEYTTQAIYGCTQVVAKAIRGFASLDTSTDPGDVDAYDASNQTLPWSPGFLSYLGSNTYGTDRAGPTFATGTVAFVNNGTGAVTFFPDALTFTRNYVDPLSGLAPTYRNSADPTIYTNPDGSVTVGVGVTINLPITAEQRGTVSNATPTTVTLTTQPVGGGCSASNPASVLASDLEDADIYRARCREAANRLTFSDPVAAYYFFATKNLDGSPLLNANGAPVNINRVWVSPDSSTGTVDVYYASPAGLAQAQDVTAANANIKANMVLVMDVITFGPAADGGQSVTTVPLTVSGSVSIKNGTGGQFGTALQTTVQNAIAAALQGGTWVENFPIGGYTQTAGAGYLYTVDLAVQAALAYVGVYDPQISAPAGASTAIGVGQVPLITSGTWTVTLT